MKTLITKEELTEFLLYTTQNNEIKVETYLHNETLWLPQKRMAELFGVDRTVVTKHLKNIFESGELEENSVSAKIAHTAGDGKKYNTKFYQHITDIFAECSFDYDKNAQITKDFYATVQNKFHFAIRGKTAFDKELKKILQK